MSMIFLAWLCISAVCDARYRKCFNYLSVSGLGLAFITAFLFPEASPVKISVEGAFLGCFLAFSVLLVFYFFGMMAAGDVKFAAALGAWLGWELLLLTWALSCGFAVAHGFVVRSHLKYFFSAAIDWDDGTQKNKRRFIPYVTYLCMATVIVLMLNK